MAENSTRSPRTINLKDIKTRQYETWPEKGDRVAGITSYPNAVPEKDRPALCRIAGYCRHENGDCYGEPVVVTKTVAAIIAYMDNSTAVRFVEGGPELQLDYPHGDVCF